MSEKELRFIEPTSFTLMNTSVNVVIAIILSIVALIVTGIAGMIGVVLMFIPTVIFGTLVLDISSNFLSSVLYNTLSKKMKCIKLDINENGEITKISAVSTALMIALIVTIISIIFYLMSVLLIPVLGYYIMSMMMYSGQLMNAMIISQYFSILLTPIYVVVGIIVIFIATFIGLLIQIAVYNLLSGKIGGAVVELKTENGTSSLESIDPIKTATIFTVVNIVISLVLGIIQCVMTKDFFGLINDVIGGAVGTFIGIAIFAVLYNYLSKKLGTIKVELI